MLEQFQMFLQRPIAIPQSTDTKLQLKGFNQSQNLGFCNRLYSYMIVFMSPPRLMMTPPRLPDNWRFETRGVSGELKSAENVGLPGLGLGWNLFSTADVPETAEAAPLDHVFGRGGLIQAGDIILRPYRRGGLVRHFNKRTFLTTKRFHTEYNVHAALWRAGLPTVEPVGYAYRRHLLGFEGVYITRSAEGQPWPKTWIDTNHSNQVTFANQVADLIESLAAWGLWAPDMNATNFLVTSDGRVLALDWDKAAWTTKPRLVERYWMRLERSLYKLNAPVALIDLLREKLRGAKWPNPNLL
jgi:hypothetical protein